MANIAAPPLSRSNNLGTAFLASASGSSDVIAFLLLGHVFASAMTGNTALLGIAISEGDMLAASKPLTPLIGFIIGAALASVIYNPNDSVARKFAILRTLLLLEILCLGAFAVVWQWVVDPTEGVGFYGLIFLCSFGMGVQGIAAKILKVPSVNTIVFTTTLASIVLSVTEIVLRRNTKADFRVATKVQIAVFGAYAAGAVFAGWLDWSEFAWLACIPAAAVVLALGCYEFGHARTKTV